MSETMHQEPGLRPPLLHRVTARQLQVIDLVIASVLVLAVVLHFMLRMEIGRHSRDLDLNLSLMVVAALSIALRRRVPLSSLAIMTVAVAIAALNDITFAGDTLMAFPMYQVASRYERRRSLSAFAIMCVTVLSASTANFYIHTRGTWDSATIIAGLAAWFVGDSVRVRRTYTAGLAEQSAQRQREMTERAQRSVAEERLQIARELHDVVAHSLSVIAVQSGVGRHVIDEQPGEAKKALAAVEMTSRSALDELRRMLGVLRREDQLPATLVPAPGVGDLGLLAEQVRAAGIPVDLAIHSIAASNLSPGADLAIYRIVQEALTNVVKHAGHASVVVTLRDDADALVLVIADDGLGPLAYPANRVDGSDAEHHGIVGMRERVALYHGSFAAGSRPEGGFRVLARFPLHLLGAS